MIVFGTSDIGRQRSSNQDEYRTGNFGAGVTFGLVCDGMGGEKAGNVASHMACDTICAYLEQHLTPQTPQEEYKQILISAIRIGNETVYEQSLLHQQYTGMGTTAVLVIAASDKAYIAHVGDSRVYMLRDGEITQVTTDHSLVQTLLEQGEITADEMHTHPQKNMITRAVGINNVVDVDYIEISDTTDTIFLLCSDGLTNGCSDEEIKNVILNSKMEQICINLIERANDAGGNDNITAVVMI